MASHIQQLENEALLLMYLADELPPEDRAEVDQLLATDAMMRAELQRVSAALADYTAGMDALDAVTHEPVAEPVAVRQIGRMMAQWHADRAAQPVEEPPAKAMRIRWFWYPAGAAAVVLIGMIAWWGFRGDTGTNIPPTGGFANRFVPFQPDDTPTPPDPEQQAMAALLQKSLESSDDATDRQVVALSSDENAQIFMIDAKPSGDLKRRSQ